MGLQPLKAKSDKKKTDVKNILDDLSLSFNVKGLSTNIAKVGSLEKKG